MSTDIHGNPSETGCLVPMKDENLTESQCKSLHMGECTDGGPDLYTEPCGINHYNSGMLFWDALMERFS